MINITKDKFQKYLEVQIEGKFNMNLLSIVSDITVLSKDKIRYIQNNYKFLNQKFPDLSKQIKQEFLDKLEI